MGFKNWVMTVFGTKKPTSCGEESDPCYVKITQEQFDELINVNKSKDVVLVPGDLVTVADPFTTNQIDCVGKSNSHIIFNVENTGESKIKFFMKQTFGPIGSLSEVPTFDYNRPMEPGDKWTFKANNIPVYAQYTKAYFWIEDTTAISGEIDVNAKIVLF